MERRILHVDANNFYASVELIFYPEYRNVPMVVGGDPELRHGIVLAKNNIAKAAGIKTAQTLKDAKALCPNLVCLPPRFKLYLQYSRELRRLFDDYTSQVEPFGLDEAWLDVTASGILGDGQHIANALRQRAKKELGLTLSVGVSYNKIFAKLGSDMKKPDATTVITSQDYRQKVWPLPAGELLYIGRATYEKLFTRGIVTIGDVAVTPRSVLKSLLGINGLMISDFANGYDRSQVMESSENYGIKSIGNSTTTPRDLCSLEDAKITTYVLAESVGARLREQGLKAKTVQIYLRDDKFESYERQTTLPRPSQSTNDIAKAALALMAANHDFEHRPLRTLGVRCAGLVVAEDNVQLSFLEQDALTDKRLRLEQAVDGIRERYGNFSVRRGVMLVDGRLSNIDAKADHFGISGGFQG